MKKRQIVSIALCFVCAAIIGICCMAGISKWRAYQAEVKRQQQLAQYTEDLTDALNELYRIETDLFQDIAKQQASGIDNRTIADGLAVGRASGFVGRLMEPFIDGCYTLRDAHMSRLLFELFDAERIALEPSALAGMAGPAKLRALGALPAYMEQGTHIVWATGGGMVPPEEMRKYIDEGRRRLSEQQQ